MKAFIRSLLLFALPLLVLATGMLLWRIDKQFQFARLEMDCRNGNWLYHRIYTNPASIDIALIGSSRTMCGVDDRLCSTYLGTQMPEKVAVANLGFCRLGRSLHHQLIQALLANKSPRMIIVEVRENEDRFSHPNFPYLATGKELIAPPLWLNLKYGEQLGQGMQHRLRYWRNSLLHIPLPEDTTQVDRLHSFLPTHPDLPTMADAGKIPGTRLPRIAPLHPPASWGYAINQQYPRSYLQDIARLAEVKGAQLVFLYLPGFEASPEQLPLELDFYRTLGPVWIPPAEMFLEPAYWSDSQHLNGPGAAQLTRWLAERIRDHG